MIAQIVTKRLLTICIVGIISCGTNEQKTETAEEAKERVIQATRNLQESHSDSLDEYILYKAEIVAQLQENELKVASFKTIIKLETQSTQDQFQKQVEQIEFKNARLKTTINEYRAEARDKWLVFKTSFNKELATVNKMIAEMDEKFIFNTTVSQKP